MEAETSDSKKIFKVFDASKRKRYRKKKDGGGCFEEFHSINTDESNSHADSNDRGVMSAKASLQNINTSLGDDLTAGKRTPKIHRDRESSPSMSNSPTIKEHHSRSPRRYKQRTGSLALKAGRASTPRTNTPPQDGEGVDQLPNDQDSYLYAFLEDAIKKDKRRQQRMQRYHKELKDRTREPSVHREHRHRHRHRHTHDSRDRSRKESSPDPVMDQAIILQTFAKLCSKLTEKTPAENIPQGGKVSRIQSHKSLQCEVVSRSLGIDQRPKRLQSPEHPAGYSVPIVRSQEHVPSRGGTPIHADYRDRDPSYPGYDYKNTRYPSKLDVIGSRILDDKFQDPYIPAHSRSYIVDNPPANQDHRIYDERIDNSGPRRCLEQRTSRSFDVQRTSYPDDEKFRRTGRSDQSRKQFNEQRYYKDKRSEVYPDRRCDDVRERRYDEPRRYDDLREKRYEESRRYDDRREKYDSPGKYDLPRERHAENLPSKDRRSRRNLDHFERTSVVSRDDDRDRYSERERDSVQSAADGEASTVSGKVNYLKFVKQEITEQREAMDKMMKLWKELMRCFKGLQGGAASTGQEKANAANVQETAAAQLRLWRECMRRYETVARDVGDTDARLMDEINKQRSEMAEMAGMWQECLQRYRDMSNDFNNLKQKLATESPTRAPTPAPPVCAEGEGAIPVPGYRIPPGYPPQMAGGPPPAPYVGSGLRTRASAPPWWWCEPQPPVSPRRRSSPESRGSRDRDRRRRNKDHDEPRYKEKSKPSGARSEHRHRKR